MDRKIPYKLDLKGVNTKKVSNPVLQYTGLPRAIGRKDQ